MPLRTYIRKFFVMKFRLIYPSFLIGATAALLSCNDDTPKVEEQPAQKTTAAQVEEIPMPGTESVTQALAPTLEEYPFLSLTDCRIECTKNEDGSVGITANLTLRLNENLMEAQQAPAAFNEERKAVNEAANKAMQPDSLYLLQIGAPTEMLTDADRAAKPMPEELQAKANKLKELSDCLVYAIKTPEGATVETTATMKATRGGKTWEIGDIVLDQAPMNGMFSAVKQSQLPDGATVLTDDFVNARREEITRNIAEFNEAAHAYILTREEAARAVYTERKALADEETRKAEEAASAATAEKAAWEAACTNFISSGNSFAGEWRRGNRFGEITLHIERAERFEGAIQFIGALYDTKLPEASLEIAGRCDLAPTQDGTAHVDVTIYDGQYDPDQPTAEVYDAQDGMLSLSLSKEGKLSGVMGCTAWGNDSDKNFSVNLSKKEAGKSKKKH